MSSMNRIEVKVKPALDSMRLDIALVKADIGLSRRKIRAVIDIGGAYINRKRVRVASRKVFEGDVIALEYRAETLQKVKTQKFELRTEDILYEDDGVVAINKPPGLPSQATKDQAVQHVLPIVKKWYLSQKVSVPELILVHRLDKETSGVLLVAKNKEIATWLTNQFKERVVKKEYYAICRGLPAAIDFRQECYLSAIKPKLGIVVKVRSGGKPSLTEFSCTKKNTELKLSLVQCRPHTGRSHQIRVHLELCDLPILGDKRYGANSSLRLPDSLVTLAQDHHFLHATTLSFRPVPDKGLISVKAPFPPNFAAAMKVVFESDKK